ncbi:MAG: hypothetical protein NTW86_11420, partial [Candidatus Sumerlaeota bacterium]|nr:hypothetical protein [Candidatus Sumerlaeota bacterium]
DEELREIDSPGAKPRAPLPAEERLAGMLLTEQQRPAFTLRSYALSSAAPLQFELRPVKPIAANTFFNRATIADGLQSLECVVNAEPRKGRLREVEALLLLPAPDPEAASRLQATGPVRHVSTAPAGDRALRVTVELAGPQSKPVQLHFQYDQPQTTDSAAPVAALCMVPAEPNGARAFLLLRRAFEGELKPSDLGGARAADPAEIQWPGEAFRPAPSDQAFELAVSSRQAPAFAIARHARDEALRAIVEVMRQRSIITADGFERHELEIVLQNQSDQFLKIALPYPKSQVHVYETQVAGRRVKTTFGVEQGRDVLLAPLIRTGLLEPELTVRVAYAVSGLPLRGSGAREQKLPEILGGVPVAQSALVLMLPSNLQYSRFEGTLNQVDQADLEVDEVMRRTKTLEKVSEVALYARGEAQQAAQVFLGQQALSNQAQIESARKTITAQSRMAKDQKLADKDQADREQKLQDERFRNLKSAEMAQSQLATNVAQLGKMAPQQPPAAANAPQSPPALMQQAPNAPQPVQGAPAPLPRGRPSAPGAMQQAQAVQIPPPQAKPAAPAAAAIAFPREGDVFAFRQVQGGGAARFHYSSRETAGRRHDVLLAAALTIVAAILILASGVFFGSRRRVSVSLFLACLIGVIARAALDVAIPGMAVAVVLFLTTRRERRPEDE